MPRFGKKCNNPLHNEWSEGYEDSKMVKLKAFGWCELGQALSIFLACEKQIKTSKKISQLCKNCIHECLKKRNITRHLPKRLHMDSIEMKVRGILME
jgi:hypothetical protein